MKLVSRIKNLSTFLNWLKPDIRYFLPGMTIILFIEVSGSLMSVGTAIVSKAMIDYAVADKLSQAGLAAAIFGGLVIMRLSMEMGKSLLSVRILESASNTMRQRIFQRLLATEWLPLSVYHSGDLLTRLTSDLNNIMNCLINVIPGILALGVQLVASFVTLFYFEPKLAILAFILGPCTVVFSRVWGRKLKHLHVKVQETESLYREYIQESIQNLIIIKSFQLESSYHDTLQGLHKNRMKWILQRNRTTLAANNVIALGYWVGYFLAFGWGIVQLAQKAISFGTLTAFLQLVQQVQSPFVGLARTFPQVIAMMGSAERLMELEKMAKERKANQVPHFDHIGIRFDQVSFAYPNNKILLDQITTEILPGQLVGLVGSSGEGKTTMVRLLLALLGPSQGEVSFTDTAGGHYMASMATRDWLTYVPQGNTLFSGTIADNLRSVKPKAALEEMEWAIHLASAGNFIQGLPQGMNTRIGERGLGLSEGQAQRIAIARAFIKRAPVLILDEATSALDTETEMNILRAVKELSLSQNLTCLIITHRPSALNICSRVLKLQDGKLSEEKRQNLLWQA